MSSYGAGNTGNPKGGSYSSASHHHHQDGGGGAAGYLNRHLNTQRIGRTLNSTENKIKEKLHEMPPILSNKQLKNLDDHKYSSMGSTLLDPFFQPYWRWLVEQVPLYVAPNLITATGLLINVLTSTILMLYSPNATAYVSLSRFLLLD
jgi:hypothetical protein